MPASPKGQITERAIAIVQKGDAVVRSSKIPRLLRFPLVALLSLTLSSLLYSVSADYTAGDLASVSRRLDQWWEVAGLVVWKTFELGLGWFGDYDGYDLAAISLLSHGPPLYLLTTFYEVLPSTALLSLIIDVVTTYIPFRLLRPLSRAHSASNMRHSVKVFNNDILTSPSIQIYITILAAGIYAITLYTAFVSYLPVYLVTYFSNIPTIAAAHSATPITLFPLTLILGLAVKSFVFTPAVAAAPSLVDAKKMAFSPQTATLGEHFWYNVWGYSKRTQVVIQRTATLVLISGINTFVQTYVTIEGVEAKGAIAYSLIWSLAAAIAGTSLGIVGAA